MKPKNNTKKYTSINELDNTITEIQKKIEETNNFLKNHNRTLNTTTSYWPIIIIIIGGYIFALILFFIDNFVA